MTTVEDLLTQKGIPYNFSGHDLLIRCLNPEHDDKNPSLRIDKIKGIGQCFSCGFSINIFNHFGIVHNLQSSQVLNIKEKIQAIYADTIGLEMPFGYSPFDKEFRGISVKTLKRYEAFTHKDFEDRIVFPIRDISGKIRVFIGRHMLSNVGKRYDIKPAHTPVPFFPYDHQVTDSTIILVEGIFDALNLIDKGFDNVVALMGLQTLNEKNALVKLAPFKLKGCSKIILLFDGDDPGRKHAETLLPVIRANGFLASSVDLPEDEDPGSLDDVQIEHLRKIIKNAYRTYR